jgi:hypothetical protein
MLVLVFTEPWAKFKEKRRSIEVEDKSKLLHFCSSYDTEGLCRRASRNNSKMTSNCHCPLHSPVLTPTTLSLVDMTSASGGNQLDLSSWARDPCWYSPITYTCLHQNLLTCPSVQSISSHLPNQDGPPSIL